MAAAPAPAAPDLAGADDGPQPDFGGDGRAPRLPQPCPVTALGALGQQIVFLDGLQQIVIASPRNCGKGELALWFGDQWLVEQECFQSYGRDGKPNGKFDQDKVQMALVADCRARGIFNPEGKVLGRGAHRPRADESKLVLHIGKWVLIAEHDSHGLAGLRRERAGRVEIAGKPVFFPASDGLPPPAVQPSSRADGKALLDLFGKWNWAEPGAAMLLLGWVGQAFVCGALRWRAHVWLPGPTASGKTSLQAIIRAILDAWVLDTADASEAAIRQMLGNDTLPVSIDEAEKHDNPERLQGVLNLMKKASSGDRILRGGADHKATEFVARSCFLLSSVLHATLRGEDRNRIALLEMRKLPEDVPPLEMELALWRSAGRRMHRRMIEQWPRFERTLAVYKRKIGERRYESRWQDTYGTLLACADLLLYDFDPESDTSPDALDEPGPERVDAAIAGILPLLAKGRVEARSDTERVVAHLMSVSLPGAHGKPPEPVGTWLSRAMATKFTSGQFQTDPVTEGPDAEARAKLKAHGLRVVRLIEDAARKDGYAVADALVDEPGWESGFLAVAYQTNAALQLLWKGTEWSGDGYVQSLGKLDNTVAPKKIRFGADKPDNALLVPLAAFRGEEG